MRDYIFLIQIKNELDRLFETLDEGDKTSMADKAQVCILAIMFTINKLQHVFTLPQFCGCKFYAKKYLGPKLGSPD